VRYPVVELLTGLLFLAIWKRYGIDVRTPLYWLLGFGLLLGTYIDIDHMILPDRVTIGGIITGLLFSFMFPVLQDSGSHLSALLRSLTGMAVGGGFLWAVALAGKAVFKKDAMGFGDVKLLAALGAWFGWPCVPFIVFISSLTGSIAGVALIVAGQKKLQSRIPFGPYIVLAAVFWMLGGAALWRRYLELFIL
jgi:leader peptidase (prepilin peptidase)/N-methyltransferase